MTITPTPPAAGWYPAPDGSSAMLWWDGTQWSQSQSQPHQPSHTNAIAKLATATQALLIACGVMSIAIVGTEAYGINAVTDYLSGNDAAIDMIDVYDRSTLAVTVLSALSLVAAGVLWVIWQYRAAKQVSGQTRRSAGWHAGSWFVPIISLWFPYQNISDLWRALGLTRPSWQIIWWLCYLVSNVVTQLSSSMFMSAEDLGLMRVAMWMSMAGEILLLTATPLAWLIVREITQGILQRASVPARQAPIDVVPAPAD